MGPISLVQRMQEHHELFHLRNAMFLPNSDRLQFLLLALGRLGRLIRKGETNEVARAKALASILSHNWTYGDGFHLTIEKRMRSYLSKFPFGASCMYCKNLPCICKEDRDRTVKIQLAPFNPSHMNASIPDLCADLRIKYGAANNARGIHQTYNRLAEEVVEASNAEFVEAHTRGIPCSVVAERMCLEVSDVQAWTLSMTAMWNLDHLVDKIVKTRYSGLHHRCNRRPCDCGPIDFSLEQLDVSADSLAQTIPVQEPRENS